ncbi:MAG: peroxiredoxin [Nitrospirota bacterium]|nr:peroxiredoxin [Nitrospirota bacterium]
MRAHDSRREKPGVSAGMSIALAGVAALVVLGMFLTRASGSDLLPVGIKGPSFSLPNQHGKVIRNTDLAGSWWVLYFYPKDDTPGCTKEACAFRDHLDRLTGEGVRVLGVSFDDVPSHLAFAEKYQLTFDLLSDPQGNAIRDWRAKSTIPGIARRVSYLMDGTGTIRKVYPGVDPSQHALEILNDVQHLKAG